ncbi:hypothetical protein MSC49_37530 (plasmid) [Methylosinus sp. C49]|uniref:hypothetical protein n=1 Tax=Methylosinus sp. C49 TaxID=2699395 RepID=UPI0013678B67|nr:hypothetical protein [Methylosinus sp. C49]BBU63818.1 hypothetical protein MSC49_37530 [Methylosinus sp. C49]
MVVSKDDGFCRELSSELAGNPTGRAECDESNLDMAADDFVIKPFHMGELQARLRALIALARTVTNFPIWLSVE